MSIETHFDAVEGQETLVALQRLMTPGQRAALVLAAEGYSMEEIAVIAGVTVVAVKGRLYRGRSLAREWRRMLGVDGFSNFLILGIDNE